MRGFVSGCPHSFDLLYTFWSLLFGWIWPCKCCTLGCMQSLTPSQAPSPRHAPRESKVLHIAFSVIFFLFCQNLHDLYRLGLILACWRDVWTVSLHCVEVTSSFSSAVSSWVSRIWQMHIVRMIWENIPSSILNFVPVIMSFSIHWPQTISFVIFKLQSLSPLGWAHLM